eukprot:TCONS_00030157-protein
MMLYLVLTLLLPCTDAWFNFNFKLAHKTYGLDDFPLIYDSILRDRATIAKLDKEKALKFRFDDFLQHCTELDWTEKLQHYFHRNNFDENDIQYLRTMNISYLMNQMPRFNLDQFWNAPIKTLVYRTAYYFSPNGTKETFELLQKIYFKNDIDVAKKINQFQAQYPNATYIQRQEKTAINKRILELIEIIQFDETKDLLKLFNVTNQLNYLTGLSFDYVNKVTSRLIYYSIQRDTKMKEEYTTRVNAITSKIQLLHSSVYHWALTCWTSIKPVDFKTTTLDSISERCFNLPFSQTAHTLYGINKERGRFLGKFDMSSASIIAQSPFQNTTLQPARSFIDKMNGGLQKIDKSKELPYYEYARSTHISWKEIESNPISVILERIQGLPWSVLQKAYGVSEASLNSLQFIPFISLEALVVKGTKSSFLVGVRRLRTVSAQTIFAAMEQKSNEIALRAAYKANVLALADKPLLSLKYLYLLKQDTMKEQTLFNVCNEMFGIRLEEFLQYFGIDSKASDFFKATILRDYASLLGLEYSGMERFSIKQIVNQIKPDWTFAEAMLVSPTAFIKEGESTLEENLRFSIPQIVDTYHKPIDSAQAFTAYIKVWSKSDETSRIVKEESLKQLGQRLKIEITVLAGMKIIDIINTVVISFGEECDINKKKYCAALQKCERTPVGDRCKCENGYRFSKDRTCIDLDECLFTNVTCHKNAECINTKGSFECACRTGFTGDGYSCTNINECEKGTHNCHEHATCIDTEGAFTCTCKLGYEGNGRECKDVDECITGLHNCHRHAECSNVEGSFNCECKKGFAGEGGRFCLDVDECERNEDNCPAQSQCVNTLGSFKCNCISPSVLTDDGKTCGQCRQNNLRNCHLDAICLAGYCVCNDGYRGNGKTCEDINECIETPNVCGRGRCSNTKGNFDCTCVNGYRSTPTVKKCIDIDECSEPRGHLLCNGTSEVCTNTDGGYACVTVKSDKAVKIALGTAIPLIVIMFIGLFIFWWMHRKNQGKKELDDFDKKLRQMYVNDAFTRDDESQVSDRSSRPIAPRNQRMSVNNFLGASKTFMNLFKSDEPEEMKKTEY